MLFQSAGGGSSPTGSLQWEICEIDSPTTRRFIERWHYTHKMPTGKNVCYGLLGPEGLYAVIVYGIGVNPYQAKFLGVERAWEIKRLCRSEPPQPYQLSRFVSLTLRWIAARFELDAIVAFADPEHGHCGGIYKACNFEYLGTTNAEWHTVDREGHKRHRRYAYRYARRKGITIAKAREELGLRRIQTQPKHRWVRRLNRHERSTVDEKGRRSD